MFSADSRGCARRARDRVDLAWRRIAVGVVPLLTLVAAVAVIVALNLMFYRTPLGRAFRATSDDPRSRS